MTRIREIRQRLGITQEELAKALGVTQGAVMQWECGLTNPKMDRLPSIAEALKCTVEELICFQ